MNKLSIKTVDGNRYDFIVPKNYSLNVNTYCQEWMCQEWMEIEQHGVKRMFYVPNIVCVTIKEESDA